MDLAARNLATVCDAIARLHAPHTEVVLHDLRDGTIAHIAGAFSRRRAGDPSLTAPEDLPGGTDVIGPYSKANPDGRRLRSVTAVIRDEAGAAVALLCVNQDVEPFARAMDCLSAVVAPPEPQPAAATLLGGDWREAVNARVAAHLARRGVTLGALRPEEAHALLRDLDAAGVFAIRGAPLHVAAVLGLSRATLYVRLKRARAMREALHA